MLSLNGGLRHEASSGLAGLWLDYGELGYTSTNSWPPFWVCLIFFCMQSSLFSHPDPGPGNYLE